MSLSKSKKIEENMSSILSLLGEDVNREGLLETPQRYTETMEFLTSGYHLDARQVVGDAFFKSESQGMVIVRDIEFFSLCEHHLLPFYGRVHVAYLPNKKIIGLSKLPRIVDLFSRRLQVQERMTSQIAQTVMDILEPHGVAVIVDAFHLCMMMRGVEKQSSKTVTSSMLGEFLNNPTTRKELLHLLGRN